MSGFCKDGWKLLFNHLKDHLEEKQWGCTQVDLAPGLSPNTINRTCLKSEVRNKEVVLWCGGLGDCLQHCTPYWAPLQVPASLFQLPANTWEGSGTRPKCLGPCTHTGNRGEAPGFSLDQLWLLQLFEGVNQQIKALSVCHFISLCLSTNQISGRKKRILDLNSALWSLTCQVRRSAHVLADRFSLSFKFKNWCMWYVDLTLDPQILQVDLVEIKCKRSRHVHTAGPIRSVRLSAQCFS